MNKLERLRRVVLDRNAVPLPNVLVSIRGQVNGVPARLYETSVSSVPFDLYGTTHTDANGIIDVYVLAGQTLKIVAFSPNPSSMGRQPIAGAYDLQADDPIDDSSIHPVVPESSGGSGGTGDGNILRSFLNVDSISLSPGAPAYSPSAGGMAGACGLQAKKSVIGIVSGDVAVPIGGSGNLLVEGTLTLTIAQWDAVTSSSGGLVRGQKYFLNFLSPGKMVIQPDFRNPPSNLLYAVPVGYALSSVEFKLEIQPATRIS